MVGRGKVDYLSKMWQRYIWDFGGEKDKYGGEIYLFDCDADQCKVMNTGASAIPSPDKGKLTPNALWGSCNGEMEIGIFQFERNHDHFKGKCHFHFLTQ